MTTGWGGGLGNWVDEGSGTITPNYNYSGALRLRTSAGDVTRVTHALPTMGRRARAEFRQRIPAYGRENGFTLYDGRYRAMLYFKPTGVRVRQRDGTTFELVHWQGGESAKWHQYRVEIDEGKGHLYVDGKYSGEWNLHPFIRIRGRTRRCSAPLLAGDQPE